MFIGYEIGFIKGKLLRLVMMIASTTFPYFDVIVYIFNFNIYTVFYSFYHHQPLTMNIIYNYMPDGHVTT